MEILVHLSCVCTALLTFSVSPLLQMEDAMDYFENMMTVDRFLPTAFMFANLVQGFAARNDIRQCFKLFNQVPPN